MITKEIPVNNLMQKELITIRPDNSIESAAWLMTQKHISCLVVMLGERVMGLVTERDFVTKVVAEGNTRAETPVSRIMSTDIHSIPPETTACKAAENMVSLDIRHFPVMKDNKILGLVTETDIAQVLPKL